MLELFFKVSKRSLLKFMDLTDDFLVASVLYESSISTVGLYQNHQKYSQGRLFNGLACGFTVICSSKHKQVNQKFAFLANSLFLAFFGGKQFW